MGYSILLRGFRAVEKSEEDEADFRPTTPRVVAIIRNEFGP